MEHTPNVVVADAIRASISLPLYFNPVKIQEKGDLLKSNLDCSYVEGDVFDNFPIRMFDDLKYWLDDKLIETKQKLPLLNTKTLGVVVLKTKIDDPFTNPYFSLKLSKLRAIDPRFYQQTIVYIFNSLFNVSVIEEDTINFKMSGDESRSILVDNLGIKPFSINLSEYDKHKILNSGREAVMEYKKRFSYEMRSSERCAQTHQENYL